MQVHVLQAAADSFGMKISKFWNSWSYAESAMLAQELQ